MPIFGQVWLWSMLAFVAGVLLCWAVVARPARTRVGVLENRLARAERRAAEAARAGTASERHPDDDRSALLPDFDTDSEPLTRAYAVPRTWESNGARTAEHPAKRPGVEDPVTHGQSQRADDAGRTTVFEPAGGGPFAPPEPPVVGTRSVDSRSIETTQYIPAATDASSSLEAPPEVDPRPADRDWFAAGAQAELTQVSEPAVGASLDDRPADDDDGAVQDGTDSGAGSPARQDDERVQPAGATIFNQHTMPIPAELIREIDKAGKAEAGKAEAGKAQLTRAESGPDQPEAEQGAAPAGGSGSPVDHLDATKEESVAARGDEASGTPVGQSTVTATEERTEVVSSLSRTKPAKPLKKGDRREAKKGAEAKRTELLPTAGGVQLDGVTTEPVNRATTEPRPQGFTVPDRSAAPALPKRIPAKPQGRHPFGVQATSPASPVAPAGQAGTERARSLFEPIVPASEEAPAVPPPLHRLRRPGGSSGPFGPGSAMPLPGGGAPSEEFTIKASVTALRYCTPDSPQFGHTVAEVWFRSAAEAERVGFRPVSAS